MPRPLKRIGIYAGTFDPVHTGHIAFALQAVAAGNLDRVYFLPERQPRNKPGSTHFGHRVAMLKRAAAPHQQFDILELVEPNFSVQRTLAELKRLFGDDDLVFLFGSDVMADLAAWPHAKQLLRDNELIIGLREQDDRASLHAIIERWPVQPKVVTILASYAPEVSSGKVRAALRRRKSTKGLLPSVERYSDHHWLYVSLG
jgi:nicotinate-nucleotide adenylyltransferase